MLLLILGSQAQSLVLLPTCCGLNAEFEVEDELDNHPDLVDADQNFPGRRHEGQEGSISRLHAHDLDAVDHVSAQAEGDQYVEYQERVIYDVMVTLATLTFGLRENELKEVGNREDKHG